MADKAKIKLVVTQAFGDFAVGAEITDAAQIETYRASHPHFVVATAAEAPPPPEGDPEPEAPPAPAPAAPSKASTSSGSATTDA